MALSRGSSRSSTAVRQDPDSTSTPNMQTQSKTDIDRHGDMSTCERTHVRTRACTLAGAKCTRGVCKDTD